jgi:hypothetical protein
VSYIDQTLGSNEKVLYRAQIHALFYIRIWALFFGLTAFIGWLAIAHAGQIGAPVLIGLFVFSTLLCLYLIMPLWALEIALTNLRIVMKRGLVTRRTHELELTAIEEVNLRQSLPGRILNYGILDVRGIGDADDLILRHVADPLSFRKAIASAVQRLGDHREALVRERSEAAKAADA